MPRKYKNKKDLRKIDENSQEYWDEILQREGLSADRGRNTKLSYIGDSTTLEAIAGVVRMRTGRTAPKKPAE